MAKRSECAASARRPTPSRVSGHTAHISAGTPADDFLDGEPLCERVSGLRPGAIPTSASDNELLTRARQSLCADWRPFRDLPEGFEWYEQLVFDGEAERRCEQIYAGAHRRGTRYHFRLLPHNGNGNDNG